MSDATIPLRHAAPARPIRATALLALLLAALMLAGLAWGSSWMPPGRVLAALAGTGARMDEVIVWTLRLPRVLLAALAGGALALAGLLLQRATRNALAAPSVLGVVDGAALGVLTFLWAFSNEAGALAVPVVWQQPSAAAGALALSGVVLALSSSDRGGALRLILYGVAMAALADALVVLMMIAGPIHRAGQALTWLAGSVQSAGWWEVGVLGAALAAGALAASLLARPLDQMRLDDTTAQATGLDVRATRLAAFGLAVLLTAAAVSVAGGIGFVGLVAPHVARRLAPLTLSAQAAASVLVGAAFVVGADLLARIAFAPLEVPVGAVTALVGVPVFLLLLLRSRR